MDCVPRHGAIPFAERALWNTRGNAGSYSGLIWANLITLPHFSVSSAMSLPKSPGEPASTVQSKLASRAFIFGSARAALISLLSVSTISAGVFLGAPMPYHVLASYPARNRPRSECHATPPNASHWSPQARVTCRP
jgi:hypothetical protein